MRDVPRTWWLGLPLGSLAVCVAVAAIDADYFAARFRWHEQGLLEHGTVLLLLPVVWLGASIVRRRGWMPSGWLAPWAALVAVGGVYFAGEECSWGQNYFGWATPDAWHGVNDQQETNLHNTHGFFNQAPRDVLTAGALCSAILPFALAGRRKKWNQGPGAAAWLFPTAACVPAAALAFLSGIPQKFCPYYRDYDTTGTVPRWFDEMFLGGRHNELKEYFLAMFILMYLWSWAARLKSWESVGQQRRGDGRPGLHARPHFPPERRDAA